MDLGYFPFIQKLKPESLGSAQHKVVFYIFSNVFTSFSFKLGIYSLMLASPLLVGSSVHVARYALYTNLTNTQRPV